MKQLFIYLLLVAGLTGINAQTYCTNYGTAVSEFADAVCHTPDNGFVVVGSTQSMPNWDVLVVKYDSTGNVEWNRTIGMGQAESGRSVAIATNGDILVGGMTAGIASNVGRMLIARLSPTGTVLWAEFISRGISERAWGITATADNGCIVVGDSHTAPFSTNSGKAYQVKLDSVGTILSSNIISLPAWAGHCGFSSAATSPTNHVVSTGQSTILAGGAGYPYLVKTKSNGLVLWKKEYQANPYEHVLANSVCATANAYYIAGRWSGASSFTTVIVLKTDTNGNLIWVKKIASSVNTEAACIRATADGALILSGGISNNSNVQAGYIIKVDTAGNALWGCYTPAGLCTTLPGVCEMNDGTFIAVGGHSNLSSVPANDMFIMQVDANGNSCCGTAISFFSTTTLQFTANSIGTLMEGGERQVYFQQGTAGTNTPLCGLILADDQPVRPEPHFSVYPNPASDALFVTSGDYISRYEIYDIAGQLLIAEEQCGHNLRIDISALPRGSYFLKIHSGNNASTTEFVTVD